MKKGFRIWGPSYFVLSVSVLSVLSVVKISSPLLWLAVAFLTIGGEVRM